MSLDFFLNTIFASAIFFQPPVWISKLKISKKSSFAFFPVGMKFQPEKIGRLRLGCLDSRTVGPNNRLPWGKGPIRSNSDEIAVIGWNNMWLSPAILGYGSSDNIVIRKNHIFFPIPDDRNKKIPILYYV